MKPHAEFLTGSGIVTDWGIHVDDRLATSVPGIVAAGDVAEAADWLTGRALRPRHLPQRRDPGADRRRQPARAATSATRGPRP